MSTTHTSFADASANFESFGITFEFAGGTQLSPNWGSGDIVFSGSDLAKFETFVGEVLALVGTGEKVHKFTTDTGSSYITKMKGYYSCPSDNPNATWTSGSAIDTTPNSVMKNGPIYLIRLADGGVDDVQGLANWVTNPNADVTCLAYHTGTDGDGNPNTDLAMICEAGTGVGNEIPFVHSQLNLVMAGEVAGTHIAKEALSLSDYDNILKDASGTIPLYSNWFQHYSNKSTPFNKTCPTFAATN